MITPAQSAHDVGLFKGLQLKNNRSKFGTVQLINESLIKPCVIKSKLPWHVIGTVPLVIDSESFRNHLNINIDVRRWEVYKTQASSTTKIKSSIHYVTNSRSVKSPKVIANVLTTMSLTGKYSRFITIPMYVAQNPYDFCCGNILIS